MIQIRRTCGTEYNYSLGCPKPVDKELYYGTEMLYHPFKDVCELYADSEALAFIIREFKNLPYKEGSCTWSGDMAQFIYNNLPNG